MNSNEKSYRQCPRYDKNISFYSKHCLKTIIISAEEQATTHSENKYLCMEKIAIWQDEEYYKGWFIEILKFDCRVDYCSLDYYCDITYRAIQDPIHLELLERLDIGL